MMKNRMLPSVQEERSELVRKIQEEIIKIASQTAKATPEALQKKAILQERVKLIGNCKEYSEARISNLQKIFKHYSTHLFRSGQKYDFDQIGYLNGHLIMERFFAFINDFKLNEISINGEANQLADRKEIILIFKKSSSNARNLDLPEFIACLERLFVFLFNENQGYKAKQDKLKQEKKQRQQQSKRREKIKKDRLKAKMSVTGESDPLAPIKQNPQMRQTGSKQNDEMMKDMMKNFQIVNPNDQVSKAAEEIKQQLPASGFLYEITDDQKIESYMLRIGIDDRKELEKKLRYFEKANYRFFQVEELDRYREGEPRKKDEEKGNQPLNLKKELTEMHEEWRKKDKQQLEKSKAARILNVMDKINKREMVKSEMHMARSLSRQKYEHKRKRMDQKFTERQLDLMYPTAKQRVTKRKEEESTTAYFSLEMLHKSTPNQLPINKINPDRYSNADPTDLIYLQEYGFTKNAGNRMLSGLPHRGNSQIIESTKRRAVEIQNQQAKRLSRLTVNLVQNHHYLQKFLERKW